MNDLNQSPILGESARDRAVAVAKGAIGMTPIAGSLLAEIVGEIVPNQRFQRIEAYLKHLNDKIEAFSDKQKLQLKQSPERVDLIEEGALKASRSLSEERRVTIAEVVAGGLDGDAQKALNQKRILDIYADLGDDDLVVLLSFEMMNRAESDEFFRRHFHLFEPLYATPFSNLETRERAALRDGIRVKLRRLGLVREDTRLKIKADLTIDQQMIETDKSDQLTELGRMILREASLIPTPK